MSWSFWWLAQLVWDDQTVESHNLLEWVTKVDLVNKNEESSLKNNLIWNMKDDEDTRPCSNCILEVLQMNLKLIDTIECYGIRLLRAIQATPRIIRACPESIMSPLFDNVDESVLLWYQTGTLTEGDLDLAGVCEIRENQFQVNRFKIFPQRQLAWNCFAALFTVTALIRSTWQCKLIESGKCWITPWSQ